MEEGTNSPQQIEHLYYVCTASEKENLLVRILEYEDPESAIIFCNTKSDVRYVTSVLQRKGFQADQISGDLQQAAREKAIKRIKAGELRFLVATDVAARGIDISDLSHVISYTASDSPETYVHRTGRTGRAGKSGIAISLVSGLDIGNFKHMQNVNKIKMVERKAPVEQDMRNRLRERLQVKVEHEMRNQSAEEHQFQIDRLIPIVEEMAETQQGRRDLAGVAAAYLAEHRPETTISEPAFIGDGDDPAHGSGGGGPKRRRRSGGRSKGGGGGRRDGRRSPSFSRRPDRT
jgi:ATP-dependent RNA helicase DeaD